MSPPSPSSHCASPPLCVSPQNGGNTPLHEASIEGHVAVVQYLVETAKADVEAKNVSE